MELGADPKQALRGGFTTVGLLFRWSGFDAEMEGDRRVAPARSQRLDAFGFALVATHWFGHGVVADLALSGASIRHRGSTAGRSRVSGLGDIEIGAAYDFAALWGLTGNRPSLVLGLRLILPTGTEAESAGSADLTVPPTVLGIGTAAFGLGARLELVQPLHRRVSLSVPVSFRTPLQTSPAGLAYGISVDYALGVRVRAHDRLVLAASVSGTHRAPTESDDHGLLLNSGGDWLRAEVALSVRATDRFFVTLLAQVPFWADVTGRQLSETASVLALLSVRFGGAGPSPQPAHPPVPPPAPRPAAAADVADAATGGRTFAVQDALVPGKVTVIDFWADWCTNCKALGARLAALAASHPDLAVRRVEVPTPESPVAVEHLGGADLRLPVVWVFDRAGRRVHALSGIGQDEILRRVRDALVSR